MPDTAASAASPPSATRTPRLGCLGVGWIGLHRLQGLERSGRARVVACADPDPRACAQVRAAVPSARVVPDLDALLDLDLDGVVIATPSALHAAQARAALARGLAVFCQKPLARDAAETRAVVAAARQADRLLGVDLSYRHVRGVPQMRALLGDGSLGRVYAARLVFHNAYGPDKPWFRDPALAGGGCLVDLGIHLVDLALWLLPGRNVTRASARLFAGGEPLRDPARQVEDYATARLDLDDGAVVELACSWNLPAGRDAEISAEFFGTGGGVRLRNVDGSFFDFRVERLHGTRREVLAEPPDDWGPRAAVAWAERLGRDPRFDPAIEQAVAVAATLDALYGREAS